MLGNHQQLNVSRIARELVYGSQPRLPVDKLVTYEEMQKYVEMKLAMAFGSYVHGLDNHGGFKMFTKTYQSKQDGSYRITANPDLITQRLITEEKCTFNSRYNDRVGQIQLQLGGFVCDAELGILKIKNLANNTTASRVLKIDNSTAQEYIEKYLSQTLLPYLF